jgi:hypothetical protein
MLPAGLASLETQAVLLNLRRDLCGFLQLLALKEKI